jgi:O-antigen/teichoic acid export membrane protein
LALTLVLVPVVALATDLLQLWLGQQFALQAATVLKLLCIGVLINAVAYVPYGLIQGVGRPDLTAKLHLTELLMYVPLLWLLLRLFGIVGAAIAWTLRATLDASLLFIFALSMVHSGRSAVGNKLFRRTGLLIGVAVVLAWGLDSLHTGVIARILLTLLLEASLALLIWRQALDDSERGDVRWAAVALARRPRSRL